MADKKATLKPDVVLNDYWKDNEKFADLLNAVFFDGKEVVRKEDLRNEDSDNSVVLDDKIKVQTAKLDRDLLKVVKFCEPLGVKFALIGAEQQNNVHYAMPIRIMTYDADMYYNQWKQLKKRYNASGELRGDEFLSGMRKTDKFYPVITIVIYYGETPWDGAKSIHELLDIPTQLQKFVCDYTMKLVEARENSYVFHNIDNKGLFELLRILYDSKLTHKQRVEKAKAYKVSNTVALAVAAAANSRLELEEIGDDDMCSVFEYLRAEGLQEGIEQGIEQGIQAMIESCQELGVTRSIVSEQVMKKFGLSKEASERKIDKYWK